MSLFPEIARTLSMIKEDIANEGYGAYRNPSELYDDLMKQFYLLCDKKGIAKYTDEWYSLQNEHEDAIGEVCDIFWEW